VWLLAVLLVAVGAFTILYQAIDPARNWPTDRFDAEQWKSASDGMRYRFVKDLIYRDLLNGLSRPQLEEMLGDPSFVARDGRYATYLVKDRTDGILEFNSVYVLQMDFDEQNKVTRTSIRGD
jgi:hypothetical protein